jgi:hypothetical protein
VNQFTGLLRTSRACRGAAFGAWTLLGGLFVLGEFAFLGWVGPAPVFLYWSIAAAPLLALTIYWLRPYGGAPSWRWTIGAGIVWLALLVVAVADPLTELSGLAAWASFLGMLVFPIGLTYQVLALVEDRVPAQGTA